MKKILILFAFLILLTNVKPSYAQHSDTLNSIADVYIITFGGGEGKNSFLKFDISSIPTANVITEVKLKIFVTDVSTQWDGDAVYSRVNKQTWLESHPNDTLWNPGNFTDTLLQPMGFASILGWTESIDIKSLFSYDYSIANTYFTLLVKDFDDWTMAPGFYPPNDSNDSMMVGNIFNDYIVYAPHEFPIPGYEPQLIVNYTLVPKLIAQSGDSIKCEMDDVSFYVTATGDSVEYQWQKNGVDMAAETNTILTMTSLALSDAAVYRCVLTNTVAADTTADITLSVNPLPVVNLGTDTSICADASILLEAGVGNDSYLWSDLSFAHNLSVDSISYGLGLTTIYVDVTKTNCTQRDSIDITFTICTNIEESGEEYLIYPNPTMDKLFIYLQNVESRTSLSLFNIAGQKVFIDYIDKGKNINYSINVEDLDRGVYLLQIRNKDLEIKETIIIQ